MSSWKKSELNVFYKLFMPIMVNYYKYFISYYKTATWFPGTINFV